MHSLAVWCAVAVAAVYAGGGSALLGARSPEQGRSGSAPGTVSRVRLVLGSPVATIGPAASGSLQQTSSPTIGALDGAGGALVLVPGRNELRVVGADGQPRAIGDSARRGASQLIAPMTAHVDAEGTALVLDAARTLLRRFRLHGDTVAAMAPVRLQGMPQDFCLDGREYVVMGLANGTLLHRVSATGAERHFGEPYGPAGSTFQRSLSSGRVQCMPPRGETRYVVAPALLPEVRGYRRDGKLRWSRPLADYREIQHRQTSPGSYTLSMPPAGHHMLVSLVPLSDELVAVQIGLKTTATPKPGQYAALETRVLRLDDGQEVGRQHDLPTLIAVRNGRALVARDGMAALAAIHRLDVQRIQP